MPTQDTRTVDNSISSLIYGRDGRTTSATQARNQIADNAGLTYPREQPTAVARTEKSFVIVQNMLQKSFVFFC